MRWIVLLICSQLMFSPCLSAQESNADSGPTNLSQSDSSAGEDDILAPYRSAAVKRWQKTIDDFEKQNADETGTSESILFIGSSSIRRWESMATDMAPYKTVRRGYGGAKFTDMALFVEQLIQPHQYRALVMFVGNGVVGKPEDHTPDLIEALARKIVAASHAHQPGVPVLLIEITPCEKRFAVWPKIRDVNARLREVALSTPNTFFVATAGHYLRPDGTPRSELFVEDKLHLNSAGYRLWSSLIRRRLDDVLRLVATVKAQDARGAVVAKPSPEADDPSRSGENGVSRSE